MLAIHVGFEIDMLADAKLAQFGLFEVDVNPHVVQGTHRHQALTDVHVISGVHIAAGDDSVDLGLNRAITQIELGLIDIALRLINHCLGLFQTGHILDDVRVNDIDVAAGIALIELVNQLLGRDVKGRLNDSELRRTLNQFGQRLAHRRKILVAVIWHVGQFPPGRRVGTTSQLQIPVKRTCTSNPLTVPVFPLLLSERHATLPPIIGPCN
jgi:hypothetical protein